MSVRHLLLACLLPLATAAASTGTAPKRVDVQRMHAFVDQLLARMTLEEKVGQLTILGAGSKNRRAGSSSLAVV